MIPSRRLVLAAALPVVLALAALFDGTLLWPMLGLDAGIAAIALVDLFLGRSRLVQATGNAAARTSRREGITPGPSAPASRAARPPRSRRW